MLIRPPRDDDMDALIELGSDLHRESAYSFLPYESLKVRALIGEYLDDQTYRCGLVAESAGTLVGMIGGILIEYYFCHEKLVTDEVLFVRSDHRGGWAAHRLVSALQVWAVQQDAREICLSVSTNVNPAVARRLYEGLGFEPVGGVFRKRLSSSAVAPRRR